MVILFWRQVVSNYYILIAKKFRGCILTIPDTHTHTYNLLLIVSIFCFTSASEGCLQSISFLVVWLVNTPLFSIYFFVHKTHYFSDFSRILRIKKISCYRKLIFEIYGRRANVFFTEHECSTKNGTYTRRKKQTITLLNFNEHVT